jgi:hypothetical protein
MQRQAFGEPESGSGGDMQAPTAVVEQLLMLSHDVKAVKTT